MLMNENILVVPAKRRDDHGEWPYLRSVVGLLAVEDTL
jgi:hypothetical protein